MPSLYAQYVMEKTNDLIIETPEGFATYRYCGTDTVYIVDIYIVPEMREARYASGIADAIVKEAKDKGCTKLIGSVVPSTKNSTLGIKTLLGYGMVLDSSAVDFLLFRKDI